MSRKITMSDKNRILWIDYVKAFAIITVVMLHIPIGDPYRHIARSFVIPVFFFLSGIFSHPSRYATFGSFFRHKTIRLLLPYVIFNVLNYLYWLLIARHYGADADMDMSVTKPLLGILSGIEPWMYHYKPLWFLPCLMVAETLFWCTYRLSCSMDKAMVLPVCMVVLSGAGYALSALCVPPLPYGIGGAMSMCIFYYGGYLLAQNKNLMTAPFLQGNGQGWLLCLGMLMVATPLCAWLSLQTAETRVFENTYGNLLYAFPATVLGGIALIAMAGLLCKLPAMRLLQYIGTHTLPILVFHLTIAGWVKGVTTFVLGLPLGIYDLLWVRLLLVAAVVLLSVPCCCIYDKIAAVVKSKAPPVNS